MPTRACGARCPHPVEADTVSVGAEAKSGPQDHQNFSVARSHLSDRHDCCALGRRMTWTRGQCSRPLAKEINQDAAGRVAFVSITLHWNRHSEPVGGTARRRPSGPAWVRPKAPPSISPHRPHSPAIAPREAAEVAAMATRSAPHASTVSLLAPHRASGGGF